MLEPGPAPSTPETDLLARPPVGPGKGARLRRGYWSRSRAKLPADAARGRPGPWVLLAAWGPCGFSPLAPGTAGTLGAIPLAWALFHLGWPGYLAATAALLAVGVVAAGRAGQYWGVVDASPIVIDEVVGYLLTVAFAPFGFRTAICGFVLFRLFDIWKPWPVSALDRIKSGWGVMLDDVGAGILGLAVMQILLHATSWLG